MVAVACVSYPQAAQPQSTLSRCHVASPQPSTGLCASVPSVTLTVPICAGRADISIQRFAISVSATCMLSSTSIARPRKSSLGLRLARQSCSPSGRAGWGLGRLSLRESARTASSASIRPNRDPGGPGESHHCLEATARPSAGGAMTLHKNMRDAAYHRSSVWR